MKPHMPSQTLGTTISEGAAQNVCHVCDSAHMAMLEQPGQYLDYLVQVVRPAADY